MSTPDRRRSGRWVVIVLSVLALLLMGLIVKPFASPFFVAAVLAGALMPWYQRLAARIGNRPQTAAVIMTVSVLHLVLLPLAVIGLVIAREGVNAATYVRDTLRSEGTIGLVNDLPAPLRNPATKLLQQLPKDGAELRQSLGERGAGAAQMVGGVLTATGSMAFHTVMMLIAFYFLLVDGERLVQWLARVSPIGSGTTLALLGDFRRVSVSVIVSSLATSAVQALVALVGYWLVSLPHAIFFAAVTFIVGLIPGIGAGGVALVAALITLLSGSPKAALFLAIWALTAVGLSDNVVKPLLMKGDIAIHGAVIFFALLGGLAVFGAIGLLAGPLIVSFFLAVARIWENPLEPPEQALAPPAEDPAPVPAE